MIKRLVIGLSGYPGCGKDEFLEQARHNGLTKSLLGKEKFAYGIQDIVALMAGFYQPGGSHRLLFDDRDWKETGSIIVGGKTNTPRYFLQQIGTEVFRDSFSTDVWVQQLKSRVDILPAWKTPVITDLRFENEWFYVQSEDGLLLYIDRPDAEERGLTDPSLAHSSEKFLPQLRNRADIIIPNYGTKNEYVATCLAVSEKILDFMLAIDTFHTDLEYRISKKLLIEGINNTLVMR